MKKNFMKLMLIGCTCLGVLGMTACKEKKEVEKTQDQLLKEFQQVVKNSKVQNQWSIVGNIRNHEETNKSFMTTDGDGIYYASYNENNLDEAEWEVYVFRKDNRYVTCLTGRECSYVEQDAYEKAYKSLEESKPLPNVLNIFDAGSIEELKQIIKENLVVDSKSSLPIDIDVRLSNEYSNTERTKVLNLSIHIEYQVDLMKYQTEITVVAHGGLVRSMQVLSTESSSVNKYEIEYTTNTDIVKKDIVIAG